MGLIAIAALGGGLAVVAARETVLASPALARWLRLALEPLLRAGREGYAPSEPELRRLAILGAAALGLGALMIAGPGPLLIVVLAGPATATFAVSRRRARYRTRVEACLPEIATAVADALSGGRSVRGALGTASASLDGPAAVEIARLGADLELGAPTAAALKGLRSRLHSGRVDAFAAALLSQQIAGGDLASLLRRFASATAERDRVAKEARAATAQARFTGLLVVAMPGGAALFAELIQPGFLGRVLADPVAGLLIAAAVVLQLCGFIAIRRLAGSER